MRGRDHLDGMGKDQHVELQSELVIKPMGAQLELQHASMCGSQALLLLEQRGDEDCASCTVGINLTAANVYSTNGKLEKSAVVVSGDMPG